MEIPVVAISLCNMNYKWVALENYHISPHLNINILISEPTCPIQLIHFKISWITISSLNLYYIVEVKSTI